MLLGAGLSETIFVHSNRQRRGGDPGDRLAESRPVHAVPGAAQLRANRQSKYRFFFNPLLEDIGNAAYVATDATIKAKADVLRRFCRANVIASILIRVNPTLAARYYLQGSGLKVTDEAVANEARMLELAGNSLPGFDPTSTTIGGIPLRGMGVLARFIYQSGLTKQIVPASAVVDDQFIAYANDFDRQPFIAQAKGLR